jgi:hypothetical protein
MVTLIIVMLSTTFGHEVRYITDNGNMLKGQYGGWAGLGA